MSEILELIMYGCFLSAFGIIWHVIARNKGRREVLKALNSKMRDGLCESCMQQIMEGYREDIESRFNKKIHFKE
jgi:uncharacterized protein YeeX (DUF496 family)